MLCGGVREAGAESDYQAYIRQRLERIFAGKWPNESAERRSYAAFCFSLYAVDGFTEGELEQLAGTAPKELADRVSTRLQRGLDQLLTEDWSFLHPYCSKPKDHPNYLGS